MSLTSLNLWANLLRLPRAMSMWKQLATVTVVFVMMLARPPEARAAISFDAAVNDQWGSGTSLVFSHTCSGSNRLLIVTAYADSDNVSGATYNGVAMTLLTTAVLPTYSRMFFYYLLGPAAGTHNVVITTSSPAGFIVAASASYAGVAQSGQPNASGTHTDSGVSTSTASLTTAVNGSWAVFGWVDTVDASLSWAQSTNRATGGMYITDSPVPPSGMTTQQAWGSVQNFATVMATFSPDGVPGPRPTNLTASYRPCTPPPVASNGCGQTFITFSETGVPGETYYVFQSGSPITTDTLRAARLIATLPSGTGIDWYYGPTRHFVITDSGPPLSDRTGLLVWTPDANAGVYYAVTTAANWTIVAGSNSTPTPITETIVATPGAVQLAPAYQMTCPGDATRSVMSVTPFYAWEDYKTWDQRNWPWYGHRFDVVTVNLAPGTTYPVTVVLHGSDGAGYQEPVCYAIWNWYWTGSGWGSRPPNGVYVFPRDNDYSDGSNPYVGSMNTSFWYGYATLGYTTNSTEKRVLRYLRFVTSLRDPASGNLTFQVDPTRVYAAGWSKGGGGAMHLAYHNPGVFAAAAPTIGWVDALSSGVPASPWIGSSTTVPDGLGGFVGWNDWTNQDWLLNQRPNWSFPPMIYTYVSDDPYRNMQAYPNLLADTEAQHDAMIAKWLPSSQTGGHQPFLVDANADWFRFKLNEAYPAFANAGNSDWPGTTNPPALTASGQRNLSLDWSSSLHSLGAGTAIADATLTFGMTLKSLTADTTADVTIRNAQVFRPAPGQQVTFTVIDALDASGSLMASGTAVADGNGLVTVTIPIRAGGCRLTLSKAF
jgi:hypothetical protein